MVFTGIHPHRADFCRLEGPRAPSSDLYYSQPTFTSYVNLVNLTAFNVTIGLQLPHCCLQPAHLHWIPYSWLPAGHLWWAIYRKLFCVWPPEGICEWSPALPHGRHMCKKDLTYKVWLLALERPPCKINLWLASGNLDSRKDLSTFRNKSWSLCLKCLYKQHDLCSTPFLLGVWNFDIWAEGAYMTSPSWKPWVLSLQWASLIATFSHVVTTHCWRN